VKRCCTVTVTFVLQVYIQLAATSMPRAHAEAAGSESGAAGPGAARGPGARGPGRCVTQARTQRFRYSDAAAAAAAPPQRDSEARTAADSRVETMVYRLKF